MCKTGRCEKRSDVRNAAACSWLASSSRPISAGAPPNFHYIVTEVIRSKISSLRGGKALFAVVTDAGAIPAKSLWTADLRQPASFTSYGGHMEPITIIILWFTSMLTIAVCTGVIAKQIESLSQIKSNPQPKSNSQAETIEAKSIKAWDVPTLPQILAIADQTHEQAQLELTVQEKLRRRYAQPSPPVTSTDLPRPGKRSPRSS